MKTYGPTMQCNSKTLDYCQMFKMSTFGHNSCPQPKSPPINRLIDDRLCLNQTSHCLSLSTSGMLRSRGQRGLETTFLVSVSGSVSQ